MIRCHFFVVYSLIVARRDRGHRDPRGALVNFPTLLTALPCSLLHFPSPWVSGVTGPCSCMTPTRRTPLIHQNFVSMFTMIRRPHDTDAARANMRFVNGDQLVILTTHAQVRQLFSVFSWHSACLVGAEVPEPHSLKASRP